MNDIEKALKLLSEEGWDIYINSLLYKVASIEMNKANKTLIFHLENENDTI